MKRVLNVLGPVLGLLALGALVVVLVLSFGSQRGEPVVLQGPPATPTPPSYPPPYPPPGTPTPRATITPPVPTPPVGGWRAENIRVVDQRQLTFEGSIFGPSRWEPGGVRLAFNLAFPGDEVGKAFSEPWAVNVASGKLQPLVARESYHSMRFLQWFSEGDGFLYLARRDPLEGDFEIRWRSPQGYDGLIATSSYPLVFGLPDQRIAWFDDNAQLMFSNRQGQVVGDPIQLPDISDALKYLSERTVALSPDGSKIVYRTNQSTVLHLVDLVSGTETTFRVDPVNTEEPAFGSAVWSPDGQTVAYEASWGPLPSLWVLNADGSGRRQVVTWPREKRGLFRALAWSPDGNVLFFTHRPSGTWPGGGGYRVHAVNLDGTSLRRLEIEDLYLSGDTLSLSPAGRWLALGQPETVPDAPPDFLYQVRLWVAELEH